MCTNPVCDNKDRWELDTTHSTFVDWQQVRVQENAQEIPAGSMPRTINVILRNEIVEKAKPGDKVIFTGTLIVVPDISQLSRSSVTASSRDRKSRQPENSGVTGLKALGVRDLTYKMCFLACSVRSTEPGFGMGVGEDGEEDVADQFTPDERELLKRMKNTPNLYSKLIRSIAPNIFGHDEIKRGVLLMLLGGVHKVTPESKQNLRGDINVCVVGDPSTSKSQFLKYVCKFLPRAIYTSGKASSAAGLTASVVRDRDTGEFTIEAGALMLADNSICCIDEFDKMDAKDQVAIHEAMEQQTISIAKAGIQATLNARTSILAAANPIKGRYDRGRTLKQNVDISGPIMSRFDLFFVVLDEMENHIDYAIATHIVNIHRNTVASVKVDFSLDELQTYIRFARTIKPRIGTAASKLFAAKYVGLRDQDASINQASYRITARQLESMIRLAEARARLDLSTKVLPEHVHEAARLLSKSIVRVKADDIEMPSYDDELDDEEEENVDMSGDGGNDDDDDNDNNDNSGGSSGKSNDTNGKSNGTNNNNGSDMGDEDEETPRPKKKGTLKVAWEKYQRTAKMIAMHMRMNEDDNPDGFKQQDVVDWYISQKDKSGALESTEDLKHETKLVRSVIGRLIKKEKVLLVVQQAANPNDRILMVHPNYSTETPSSQASNLEATPRGVDFRDEEETPKPTMTKAKRKASSQQSPSKRRKKDGDSNAPGTPSPSKRKSPRRTPRK